MRKFRNLPKTVLLTVILLITCTLKISAQPQYTQKRQSAQEKRQQLEQEASTATSEVTTKYQEILGYVNSGKTPSMRSLGDVLKTIAKDRKYLPVFDDSQKSTYHILSAWVYYFDNKQDKALKQAAFSQKAAPQNPDAAKTRLALSVTYRDYTSAIEALTEQITSADETDSQSYQQTNEGGIQLDINSVRIGLLGKTFDFQPQPVEPNSTSWQPSGQLTCTLLWEINSAELDHFAPVKKAKPAAETNEPNKPQHEPNLPVPPAPEPLAESNADTVVLKDTESQSQESSPVAEGEIPASPAEAIPEQQYQTKEMPELGVFSQLQSQFAKDKRTVFAGINLNDPAKIKNLENWLSKNPQIWQTFLLSAEQQQKMLACFSGDFNEPVLLIVAPNNTIRYAGKVEGFLPKMIIRSILENPQEFAEPNEPNHPPAAAESNLPAVKSVQPAQLPAEPNITPASIADANKTTANTQQPQTTTASAPVKQQVMKTFPQTIIRQKRFSQMPGPFSKLATGLPPICIESLWKCAGG